MEKIEESVDKHGIVWYSIKAVCELRLEDSRKDSEYRKSLKEFEKSS